MEKRIFEFLSSGRFLLWTNLMTFADIVLTYVGLMRIGKDYEFSPFVSFVVAQWGFERGFIFLMFCVSAFFLLMTVRWELRWVKRWALAILILKGATFLYHFLALYVNNLLI